MRSERQDHPKHVERERQRQTQPLRPDHQDQRQQDYILQALHHQ